VFWGKGATEEIDLEPTPLKGIPLCPSSAPIAHSRPGFNSFQILELKDQADNVEQCSAAVAAATAREVGMVVGFEVTLTRKNRAANKSKRASDRFQFPAPDVPSTDLPVPPFHLLQPPH